MLLTIAICTYNRCGMLSKTMDAILGQEVPAGVAWELLVVDNNSKDQTREVVTAYASRHPQVRYLFEPQQGITHARNRTLAEARGSILACTDDDILPAPNWVRSILRTAEEHPDLDLFGGKVLPTNQELFPSWLTPEHYSPLALLDRGEQLIALGPQTGLLVGANMVLRPGKLKEVGLFKPELGRVKDSIGSLEDDDYMRRVIHAGHKAAYVPSIVVFTEVQEERLHAGYHWRWSLGHGRFTALRRLPEMERSHRYLFGVPGHIWRQGATALFRLPLSAFHGEKRMHCLNRVCWAAGFIQQFRNLPPLPAS